MVVSAIPHSLKMPDVRYVIRAGGIATFETLDFSCGIKYD
jgi:hypothetical protein